MKKLARVKPIARWTAWVLTVLLPAMWVFTCWGNAFAHVPIGHGNTRFGAGLSNGAMFLGTDDAGVFRPSYLELHGYPIFPSAWWPYADRLPSGRSVAIPLWMPSIVAIGASIWFYRDHRREKMRRTIGRCPACGYDRSGLAQNAPCPECAAPATHR